MRTFIRHPTDIPLEYKIEDIVAHQKEYLNDISEGGLSFRASAYIEPGSSILIHIPLREPVFETKGVVVWCKKSHNHYDAGVRFLDTASEYKTRMVEQVCHIEHYRAEILKKEGRKLTGQEAALEWIRNHAQGFPR